MVLVLIVNGVMKIDLYQHQRDAVDKLKNGNILLGGVGSGKSRTALYYYNENESTKDLYIITTARKRDTLEWDKECKIFNFQSNIVIDSWNNIHKYTRVRNAFFIFDEQKVIGSGVWVKSFLEITKFNSCWILLSATPGDVWMDYVPVFIANGYYKNRTEFIRRHVVYNNFSKYPKIDRYMETARLKRLRDSLVVEMRYDKKTIPHKEYINVGFDKNLFDTVFKKRWNFYDARPIKNITETYYLMRRVVNSDERRIYTVEILLEKHPKIIIFYNFNYERDMLLEMGKKLNIPTTEWNGHNHQSIPSADKWIYIVQYAAGAEGWNCTETNVIVFYSQNYSYKTTVQAAGRIDRLNTKFKHLYYYYLTSNSYIDNAIKKAFDEKRNFNETDLGMNF